MAGSNDGYKQCSSDVRPSSFSGPPAPSGRDQVPDLDELETPATAEVTADSTSNERAPEPDNDVADETHVNTLPIASHYDTHMVSTTNSTNADVPRPGRLRGPNDVIRRCTSMTRGGGFVVARLRGRIRLG